MSKRTQYTVITPLPAGITRATVMDTLHCHTEMIDLNPLVEERHPIKAPENATAEEFHCVWYSITDRVSYLPGGVVSGKVTYSGCFHDLSNGLQTHCYAPLGLDIKGKWTLGGSLPGEPQPPVEIGIGIPLTGLYIREDVDFRCNIVMTSFVKKTLKKAHEKLVSRLVVKSQLVEAANVNDRLSERSAYDYSPRNSSFLSRSGPGSVHSIGSPAFPPSTPMHSDAAVNQPAIPPSAPYHQFNPALSPGLVSPGVLSPGSPSPGYANLYGNNVDPAYQHMSHYMQQHVPVGQHELTPAQQRMYLGTTFAPSELPSYDGQKNTSASQTYYEENMPVELPADVPS